MHGGYGPSAEVLVFSANVLDKPTGSARRLALERLRGLDDRLEMALYRPLRLFGKRSRGRPMLALLCALARDPLLRDSAEVIIPANWHANRWPLIADRLISKYRIAFHPKC